MIYDKEEINNIAAYALDGYMEQLGDKALLIDVRDEDKYKQNHIDGAINLPYRQILDKKASIPEDRVLVVYCDRGGLSMTIARYLSKKGFAVVNVIGGLRNYKKKK